jgi:hypothetical protein
METTEIGRRRERQEFEGEGEFGRDGQCLLDSAFGGEGERFVFRVEVAGRDAEGGFVAKSEIGTEQDEEAHACGGELQ